MKRWPCVNFLSVFLTLFKQTVRDVGQKSSRVSLSWHWRSSGTSAALGVRPAAWSWQESTSASKCANLENIFFIFFNPSLLLFYIFFLKIRCGRMQIWHASTIWRYFCVAETECRTVKPITTHSLGWNARDAADTSADGFWRWDTSMRCSQQRLSCSKPAQISSRPNWKIIAIGSIHSHSTALLSFRKQTT